jgi:hypothetical protein
MAFVTVLLSRALCSRSRPMRQPAKGFRARGSRALTRPLPSAWSVPRRTAPKAGFFLRQTPGPLAGCLRDSIAYTCHPEVLLFRLTLSSKRPASSPGEGHGKQDHKDRFARSKPKEAATETPVCNRIPQGAGWKPSSLRFGEGGHKLHVHRRAGDEGLRRQLFNLLRRSPCCAAAALPTG